MAVPDHRLVDTMPAVLRWWPIVAALPAPAQAERWHADYLAAYPELRDLLLADIAADGLDWREVMATRVLPTLPARLPSVQEAYRHLPAAATRAVDLAADRLGLDFPVASVLYLGVGYAGWATTYGGRRAVLYGLEGLAENGWTGDADLLGLATHELGHLLHFEWRARAGLPAGRGAWESLYTEGFAMLCERLATGADTWHMGRSQPGWAEWCREHRTRLAADYLAATEAGEPVNRFYGNWFDVDGWRQTGYWLGSEVLGEWLTGADLRSLALLTPDDVARRARESLRRFAATAPGA